MAAAGGHWYVRAEGLQTMHFDILGPLRVTDQDGREIDLGGAKPASVLAMLAVRPNEVVSSDRLIEDLWDGQPPQTAAKTLQVHVSRLRRALTQASNGDGAPVVTRAGGYVLLAEPDQIDALRFERLVAEGGAALAEGAHARASARLRTALALWRGPALSDFAYASFAQDPIARLDALRMVAFESAIEAELALGRHRESIPELKSLLKRQPLSERLRAQLMLALYRSGRQAEALGVYRAGRRMLVDRLGIEPGAELRELERAILAQDAGIAMPATERPRRHKSPTQSPRGLLVGYEQELAALEEALEQSLSGRGGLALISGEPGVGKTRLADELASVARARGAQVVWGRAWEGGGAPPFWSWTQVLRALAGERDPVTLRAELGPAARELAPFVPELQDLTGEADGGEPADPEEASFRLYNSTAGFLSRVAAAQPLVVVLDDLHAADSSTLALLRFMATVVQGAPILIVATYRDTEVVAGQPLSDALDDLTRAGDCFQLVLTGLASDDTAHFVELSAGVAPMTALAAAIHAASRGNPLFVSELVRLLRAEGRLAELGKAEPLALPRGIDQVITRRLQHLSAPCRDTLALAAVIGREFGVALLEAAGDVGGRVLLDQLGDAVGARVVEESHDAGGTFHFSHELVRQALYSALPPAERTHAHTAIARALEDLGGAPPAELARHWVAALPAGDPSKAIEYLTLAGDEAAELSAHHEAAAHYERAAAIARAKGSDAEQACELYIRLAEQLVLIPEPERARGALVEAESLGRIVAGDPRDERLAIVRAELETHDACTADLKTITDLVDRFRQRGDAVNEARAWWALCGWYRGRNRNDKALAAAEKMLACARRARSRGLVAQALRGIASSLTNGATPSDEAIRRLRALLADATDRGAKARLEAALAELEAARGRFSEARIQVERARSTAGAEPLLECTILGAAASVERLAGNPRATEELARALCARFQADGLLTYLATYLTLLVDALVEQGRLEEAAVELGRAVAIVRPDDEDALFRQARSRGLLELARGELASAEASIRSALEHAVRIEAPADRAETLLALARVLTTAGRGDEAREVAHDVLAISDQTGREIYALRARELLGEPQPAAAARLEAPLID